MLKQQLYALRRFLTSKKRDRRNATFIRYKNNIYAISSDGAAGLIWYNPLTQFDDNYISLCNLPVDLVTVNSYKAPYICEFLQNIINSCNDRINVPMSEARAALNINRDFKIILLGGKKFDAHKVKQLMLLVRPYSIYVNQPPVDFKYATLVFVGKEFCACLLPLKEVNNET